jgi:prepilin-type processing-associated H-X9-DG protein
MCPRFRPRLEALIEAGEGFERGNGGYGYNNAFVGTRRSRRWVGGEAVWDVASDASGSRVSRFDGPARTVAFADAAFAGDGGLIEYSFAEPAYWPGYAGDYRPDPSIHFRQVGGEANVAWLDGRVSQEERTATHWSGIYAVDPGSVGLGWFGDASGNALFDYE